MRKIKELEARIDKLERLEKCNEKIRTDNDNFLLEKIDNINANVNKILYLFVIVLIYTDFVIYVYSYCFLYLNMIYVN